MRVENGLERRAPASDGRFCLPHVPLVEQAVAKIAPRVRSERQLGLKRLRAAVALPPEGTNPREPTKNSLNVESGQQHVGRLADSNRRIGIELRETIAQATIADVPGGEGEETA
jgi:hypothetical protein